MQVSFCDENAAKTGLFILLNIETRGHSESNMLVRHLSGPCFVTKVWEINFFFYIYINQPLLAPGSLNDNFPLSVLMVIIREYEEKGHIKRHWTRELLF